MFKELNERVTTINEKTEILNQDTYFLKEPNENSKVEKHK